MSHIATAIAPLKLNAMEQARAAARYRVSAIVARMERAGWDAQVAAPYPTTGMGKAAYVQAKALYDQVRGLTTSTHEGFCRRPGSPDPRKLNEEAVERMVQRWAEMAAASFDAFVAKLESKVGEHDACELLVDGTWAYSVLAVRKGETVERWKTQQIINCSVLGNLFNQWPTRLMK